MNKYITGAIILVIIAGNVAAVGFHLVMDQIHGMATIHRPAAEDLLSEEWEVIDFYVTTEDNLQLEARYISELGDQSSCVIINVHGAADQSGMNFMSELINFLIRNTTCDAVSFSHRNFAGSEGDYTSFGVWEHLDVKAVYQAIAEMPETEGKSIGFISLSMGSGSTLTAAGLYQFGDFYIASVAYEEFSNAVAWRASQTTILPYWLVKPLAQAASRTEFGSEYEVYQPVHQVDNIEVPVLLITSDNDQYVNPDDSFGLAELIGDNAEVVVIENGGHDIFRDRPEEFKSVVLEFLAEVLP